MKIGISAGFLGGEKSGIGVWLESLIESLQKNDHHNKYQMFLPEQEKRVILNPYFHNQPVSNIFSASIPNIIWHNCFLPIISKREKLDVVHIPTIRRIPLVKGCKLVVTVHDLAAFRYPEKYGKLRTLYHTKILSKAVHLADRITTVSHNTKKDLIELTGYPEEKIKVIYPGVREIFKPMNSRAEVPFFFYVSRLEHPGKNHIRLIEAFDLFKKRTGAPHELLFAGADWQDAEKIKAAASKSRYAQSIRFLGFSPINKIVELYSSCDLMIYPSLYEGFGMPVIEAMACGAPVICSKTSSLKEIGESTTLQFNPEDPVEMCNTIEQGLKKDFQDKARKYGPVWAAYYSWDQAAVDMMAVYQEAFSG